MSGYNSPIMKWIKKVSHLDAFTSAPCSMNSFSNERSFPPDKAACNAVED